MANGGILHPRANSAQGRNDPAAFLAVCASCEAICTISAPFLRPLLTGSTRFPAQADRILP